LRDNRIFDSQASKFSVGTIEIKSKMYKRWYDISKDDFLTSSSLVMMYWKSCVLEVFLLIPFLTYKGASEPTIIFMGNGRPVVTGPGSVSSPSTISHQTQYVSPPTNNGPAYTIQTIKTRDSNPSSGGTLSVLASVIRDRLGEKFQERSAKKGPRIIVIPTGQKQSPPPQSQSSASPVPMQSPPPINSPPLSSSYPASSYNGPSPSAPASYSGSPYSYAQASMYSPTYVQSPYSSGYGSYGPVAPSLPYPSPYSYPGMMSPPSSMSSSSSSPYAASTAYASYAYAPSSYGSFFSSLPSIRNSYQSLYPYLAQLLASTLYQ
jgi:hypothetical protein